MKRLVSSWFSRCGTPRLPVPFFLAGRPQLILSTSRTSGRQQCWRACQNGASGWDDCSSLWSLLFSVAVVINRRGKDEERADNWFSDLVTGGVYEVMIIQLVVTMEKTMAVILLTALVIVNVVVRTIETIVRYQEDKGLATN